MLYNSLHVIKFCLSEIEMPELGPEEILTLFHY